MPIPRGEAGGRDCGGMRHAGRRGHLTLEPAPRSTVDLDMTQTISKIAGEAVVSPDTLRYYERLGLVPTATRAANRYRHFDPDVVSRVLVIKGAQRSGLRLAEIKELLEIWRPRCLPHAVTPALCSNNACANSTKRSTGCGSCAQMLAGIDP